MPFPVDIKFVRRAEAALGIAFPASFIKKMLKENGGELFVPDVDDYFQLFSFFDDSDKKRLARTCSDIVKETAKAREWRGFPAGAVAIGTDAGGNLLVLLPDPQNPQRLGEPIFDWFHETADLTKLTDSLAQLAEQGDEDE